MNKSSAQSLVVFLTGGIIYFYFEILVRGYSHVSMFLLGGLCFYLVGRVGNYVLIKDMGFVAKLLIIMIISGCIITSLEFLTGLIVNVYMKLEVWDYSNMKMNFMGQICLLYTELWALLGLPCVYFYGMLDKFVLEG